MRLRSPLPSCCPACPPEPFDLQLQRSRDGLVGSDDAHCADVFHTLLGKDLPALEHCRRAYVVFVADEHAALLRDLCAGRDLLAGWGKRLLGGFLPPALRVPYDERMRARLICSNDS